MSSRVRFLPVWTATAALLLTADCGSAASPISPSSTPITVTGTGVTTYTYAKDIQPILATDCARCHGPSQQQAGVNLSTYAGVLKVATDGSDASFLIRVTQPNGAMYSELSGNRTQKAQIIYDWIMSSHVAQ